ncbi:MAG: hypothetical protein R6X31_15515 [Anaerolineae bacterium]
MLYQVFDVATRAGLHCAPQVHRTAGTLDCGALAFSPGSLRPGTYNTPSSPWRRLCRRKMAKQPIERTLIILDEEEVRRVLQLSWRDDVQEIYEFVRDAVQVAAQAWMKGNRGDG